MTDNRKENLDFQLSPQAVLWEIENWAETIDLRVATGLTKPHFATPSSLIGITKEQAVQLVRFAPYDQPLTVNYGYNLDGKRLILGAKVW